MKLTKKQKLAIILPTTIIGLSAIAIPPAIILTRNKTQNPDPESGDVFRTITFNSDGGEFISGKSTQIVLDGTLFKEVNKPTCFKQGYLFKSWDVEDDIKINSDLTINATYVEDKPVLIDPFEVEDGVLCGFKQDITEEQLYELFSSGVMVLPDCNEIAIGAFDSSLPNFIEEVVLPPSLEKINECGFSNNANLKKISFKGEKGIENSKLTTIKDYAFQNTGLESLVFPPLLSSIGYRCFYNCEKLVYIDCTLTGGSSGVSLFDESFENISELGKIISRPGTENDWIAKFFAAGIGDQEKGFPDEWRVEPFSCLDIEGDTCYGFRSDLPTPLEYLIEDESKELFIPKEIKHISNSKGGFKNNKYIETLNIPSTVETIDSNTFEGCSNLKVVNLSTYNNVPDWKGKNIFLNASKTGQFEIDNSLREDWTKLLEECSGVKIGEENWLVGYDEPITKTCVGMQAIEPTEFIFKNNTSCDMQYSTDEGLTWNVLESRQPVSLNTGDVVYFKGNNPNGINNSDEIWRSRFEFNKGKVSLKGDIMGLVYDGMTSDTIPSDFCFAGLFENCSNIVEVPDGFLPATNLTNSCYNELFKGCSSLINMPSLPAKTLKDKCYKNLFFGCSNIQKAKDLIADQLAEECYWGMFSHCTSIPEACKLPAIKLATNCYTNMFLDCQGISKLPDLPAEELVDNCYNGMFAYCEKITEVHITAKKLATRCMISMFAACPNLTKVEVDFESWDALHPTQSWLFNGSPTGTFICPQNLVIIGEGTDYVPTGWTVQRK